MALGTRNLRPQSKIANSRGAPGWDRRPTDANPTVEVIVPRHGVQVRDIVGEIASSDDVACVDNIVGPAWRQRRGEERGNGLRLLRPVGSILTDGGGPVGFGEPASHVGVRARAGSTTLVVARRGRAGPNRRSVGVDAFRFTERCQPRPRGNHGRDRTFGAGQGGRGRRGRHDPGHPGGGRARGGPAAAASGPAVVQSAGGSGSNATTGSSVGITATLAKSCSAGDTLVAFVTVAQQGGDAGAVVNTPTGWRRLYEHSPSDHVAAFHTWFALSACSGVSAATFTVSAPGNPDGTTGIVVLTEYSGLPSTLLVEDATNNGDGGGDTSGSLTADISAPSGTVVLAALSIYAPSTVTSTPSGWSSAGSQSGSLVATTWWRIGREWSAFGLSLLDTGLLRVGDVHAHPRGRARHRAP